MIWFAFLCSFVATLVFLYYFGYFCIFCWYYWNLRNFDSSLIPMIFEPDVRWNHSFATNYDTHYKWCKQAKKEGKKGFFVPSGAPWFLSTGLPCLFYTADASKAKELLWCAEKIPTAMARNVVTGVTQSEGAKWRKLRKLYGPFMTTTAVKKRHVKVCSHVEGFLSCRESLCDNSIHQCVFDLMCKVAICFA